MTTIKNHLALVHDRIRAACASAGRSAAEVQLLAVSKTFGAQAVIEAVLGRQRGFCEKYNAESVEKNLAPRRWQSDEAHWPGAKQQDAAGSRAF